MKRKFKWLYRLGYLFLIAIPAILILTGAVPTLMAQKFRMVRILVLALIAALTGWRIRTGWKRDIDINWDYDPEPPKEDEK